MTTRIKLRRDTATNWTATNPVLALGEPGYDTTNNKIKVGNGTSTWTQLSYLHDETGGGGGSFNGTATGIELTGRIPTVVDLLVEDSSVWIRTNNNENIVADIAPGIRLKRKNASGAIYNAYNNTETQWSNDTSPVGTRWNADGWGDLADVQTRNYTTFYQACDQNIGEQVVGREFVMHDTINDQYFKIEFTFWQPANGGGSNQIVNLKGGLTMIYTPITLTSVTYFVRGANDTSLGDTVGPGLTIKRGVNGGLYNSEEEAEWDPDNTPTGTLWNAEHEWRNFIDITALTWKPLYAAVHGHLGNNLVGKKLLMWDTINDKYYTVKFTDWGVNNGGSFAYVRREIVPSTGLRNGITFADGSFQDTATTLGDLHVVNDNVIENSVHPGYGAEIRYDVKNNYTWGTWAWTGTANWVTSGSDGTIQFNNSDANNSNQVDFRNFLNELGRWYIKTVRINDGEPQTIIGWGYDYINTDSPPATNPTVVTELRFDVVYRSRMYMGGENTVGFFLNDRDDNFEVQSRDFNVYARDDVRIQGKNYMEIRNNGNDVNNDYIQIVTDGDNSGKTWRFTADGSLQLPNMDSTAWNYNLTLNGNTLKLGHYNQQTIVTGPTPRSDSPSAQRLIIQGQRGYGEFGQNTVGEGGDVYIWGGTGGERDTGQGGSGGDVKLRGGQGQNAEGGYVRIEAGPAAHWGNLTSGNGGFVEINGGNVTEIGGVENNHGGPVTITAGKANSDETKSGNITLRTGGSVSNSSTVKSWIFDNRGTLTMAGNVVLASGVTLNSTAGTVQVGHPPISIALIDTINLQNVLYVDVPDQAPFNTIVPGDIITMNQGGDPQSVSYTGFSDGNFRIGLPTGYYQAMDFPLTVTSPTYIPFVPATSNISVSGNTWSFIGNGNLVLPQGSTISDGDSPAWNYYKSIDLHPANAPCSDQYLRIYPTVGGDGNHLHLTSGNLQLSELFLGNDAQYVKLVSTGAVDISTNDMAGNSAVWSFGTDGNLTLPANGAIVATTVPATGDFAVAGEPSYSYNGTTMAVFDPVDFSQGVLSSIQAGWTVSNGAGFSDTILSTNNPIPGAITTTSVYWPTGGGQTYTFTGPDYVPETATPVIITVGDSDWKFDSTGNITLPQTNLNASPAPVSWPGITFSDGTFQNSAYTTTQANVLLNSSTESGHAGYTISNPAPSVIMLVPEDGYDNTANVHAINLPAPMHVNQKITIINYYDGNVALSWNFGVANNGSQIAPYENSELTAVIVPGGVGLAWWETNRYSW